MLTKDLLMKSYFIPNYTAENIPQKYVDGVKNNNEAIIDEINVYNFVNNFRTYYVLENGLPKTCVQKVVR